jgi:hypothetical protein
MEIKGEIAAQTDSSSSIKLTDDSGNPITSTNPFPVTDIPSSDVEGVGTTAVGTTAVAVTLTGVTTSIIISADIDNTGVLYIGKSNVTNLGANAMAFLYAGESLTIDYNDSTNALYVVSDTAAQNFWSGAVL